MANETNTLPTPDEAPDHVVQDTTDFHEQGDQQEQRQQPQKKEEVEEAGEKEYFVDQKRADIVANARKAKAETSLEFTGSDSDPKVRYGTGVDESDLGPLEQEALARQREVRGEQRQDDQHQQQQQQRPLQEVDQDLLGRQVKIVFNGQEQIITVEEALRRAQKIAAADDYFVQAKDTLREVKELRHEIGRRPNQGDGQGDGQDGDDQRYDDRGERRDTTDLKLSLEDAEKIQMGTTEEVQAVMDRLLKTAAPAVSPVDVAQEVRNTLELERTKNEVQRYVKDYPDFADPYFQRTIADFTQMALRKDILDSGVTPEQFQQVLKNDPNLIKEFHRQARQRGMPGFRSPLELTKAGHAAAHKWRTGNDLPAARQQSQGQNDALNLQQREQRKQQLQQQPQQRRQTQPNLPNQNKTQDQGRSGRFEAIKKARGQPT